MKNILNVPEYARNYKFIVYRTVKGENWFYGAYNDYAHAIRVMCEINGKMV